MLFYAALFCNAPSIVPKAPNMGRCKTSILQRPLSCLIPLLLPLAAGVVDGGLALKQNLGDGDNGITLGLQGFDDAGQSLGCVLGGIMEEDDAAGAHILQHPLLDLLGRDALPIQAVAFPYS